MDLGSGDTVLFEGEEFDITDFKVEKDGDDAIVTFGGSSSVSVRLKDVDADDLRNEDGGYSISGNDNDGTVAITFDGSGS